MIRCPLGKEWLQINNYFRMEVALALTLPFIRMSSGFKHPNKITTVHNNSSQSTFRRQLPLGESDPIMR